MADFIEEIIQKLKQARASAALLEAVSQRLANAGGWMPFAPEIIQRNIRYDNLVLRWTIESKELYFLFAKRLNGEWRFEITGTIGEIWNEDFEMSVSGIKQSFTWLKTDKGENYGK